MNEYLDEANLFKMLRDHTRHFEQEVPVSQFDLLSITPLESLARRAGTEDGSLLKVQVRSEAKSALEVDDVRMCLSNGERDQLWLTSGKLTLKPGLNDVEIQTPTPAPGKYVVDVSQVRFSRVIFQYSYPRGPLDATFVDVPQDGEALDASMELPKSIMLDRQRLVLLKIETGRNDVQKASIRIALPDAQSRPLRGLSEASTQAESTFDEALQTLSLSNLSKNKTYIVELPLQESPTSADGIIKLSLSVDYWTKNARVEVKRQLRKRTRLTVGLPLGVNVQDFFRRRNLISKFSISAGQGSSLRLGTVKLSVDGEKEDGGEGLLEIVSPLSEPIRDTVVAARDPASYVFCVRRQDGNGIQVDGDGKRDMRLRLAYRTLHEEAKELVECILKAEMEAASMTDPHVRRCLEQFVSDLIERQVDILTYEETGNVLLLGGMASNEVLKAARRDMRTRWGMTDQEQEEAVLALITKTLTKAASGVPGKEELSWRSLEIVVEVPSMDVVCAASILLPEEEKTFVVGQPIEAKLRIRTSFNWRRQTPSSGKGADAEEKEDAMKTPRGGKMLELAPPAKDKSKLSSDADDDEDEFEDARSRVPSPSARHRQVKTMRLLYDVGADFEHWLVSGRKRCAFEVSSQQEEERTFDVVLIPAKTGHLLLPTVSVWPIAAAPTSTPPSTVHPQPYHVQDEDASGPLPSCETYVENAAQGVFIMPSPNETRRRYWLPATTFGYEQEEAYEHQRQQLAYT